MIETVFNSIKDERNNKVVICRDSMSEHLSEIVFDRIINILLNKKHKNVLIYDCNNTSEKLNVEVRPYDMYLVNIPYVFDFTNRNILISSEVKYNADIIIILKENKLTLFKHKTLNTISFALIDMIPIIRQDKIMKLKKNIYNKQF